jgi:hypothetical protein
LKDISQITSTRYENVQKFVDACCSLTDLDSLPGSSLRGAHGKFRATWAKLLHYAERGDTNEFNQLFNSLKAQDQRPFLLLKGYLYGKQGDTDNVLWTIEQHLSLAKNACIPTALHNQMILSFSTTDRLDLAEEYYDQNVFIPNQSTLLAFIEPLMEKGDALSVERALA